MERIIEDDTIDSKIKKLIGYYTINGCNEQRFTRFNGTYEPSDLNLLVSFLFQLEKNNLLLSDIKSIDLGSGDFRVASLFNIFNFDSYGIESDLILYDKSLENITYLSHENIVNKNKIHIAKGDFFDPFVYNMLGIQFKDINLVYSYNILNKEIIEYILKYSNSGTLMIVNGQIYNEQFKSLKKLFEFKENSNEIRLFQKL